MALSAIITNCTVTRPQGSIAVGETIEMSVTVKNDGTVPITVSACYLYNGDELPGDPVADINYPYFLTYVHASNRDIQANRTATFAFTLPIPDPGLNGAHVCTPKVFLRAIYDPGSGPIFDVYPSASTGIPVLDVRYRPTVTALTVTRTPSEDSTQLKATVQCSLAEGADSGDAALSLKLRWREAGGDVFANENVASVSVASALSSTGATVTLPGTFSAGIAYEIQAEFTDGYDTGVARTTVSKSHANIHLSVSGYGFAVGQYSTGTQAAPLFESSYPARFYEGIEGVNVYTQEEVSTGGKWVDGKAIYARTLVLSKSGTSDLTRSFSFSGMDTVWVDAGASFYAFNDNVTVHLGCDGSKTFKVLLRRANNQVAVGANGAGTAYVRLMYTKA